MRALMAAVLVPLLCGLASADNIAVIGAGFSGLAAALEASSLGHTVTVFEGNAAPGGRAQKLEVEGFTFDMGPSWYWMPEIYDKIFARYGFKVDDYYSLKKLDPAYRVYFPDEAIDVPGDLEGFLSIVQDREPSAVEPLRRFFDEAKTKYSKGVYEWIWKPHTSMTELIDFDLIKSALTMDMFGPYDEHINKYTKNKKIRTLLEWPVMFIGLSPHNAPSLYSLMTYAGHAGGTFYPEGGMHTPADALAQIATKMGTKFKYNTTVESFKFASDKIESVCTVQKNRGAESCEKFDGVIAAADYHHVEQNLLPRELRRYTEAHWDQQVLSPSVILFYLGFDKKLPDLLHHTLFFDDGLEDTQRTVFEQHTLTEKPAFYVSATSKTDATVAPEGGEAVFVLIPISYQLSQQDTPEMRQQLKEHVLDRMEAKLGYTLRDSIVYQSDYGPKEFESQFHAFKGNAFGHANLLSQSLCLKPSMDSLVSNMVFAGHLTHPGPGVPPALVSGNVAATLLDSKMHPTYSYVGTAASAFGYALLCAAVAVVLASAVVRCVPRWNSYVRCIDLMFRHGKTYYAASTLMAWEQYLDTCCLYAVFREADDIVDCFAPEATKRAELEDFMNRFWAARRTGVVNADDPIIFPAMISTIRKFGYEERLWQSFFRSMASDISHNVCLTMEDTMEYMDGSAAVLGEFMLPLLGPDHEMSAAERVIATPHARDLGLAFQLTNMLRDIGEDIDFDRQYIPVEVCQKYGVDLSKRDHTDPQFQKLMEHMMQHTESFYASADLGIAMLPVTVRTSIQAARAMYSQIHERIRAVKYDIFSKRVKVSSLRKLKIASQFVPRSKLVWMAVMDRGTWLLLELYYNAIPLCLVLYGLAMSLLLDGSECSYERFLGIYVVVPIVALGGYVSSSHQLLAQTRSSVLWIFLLCVLATVWTTPWDNYLVYSGVWGYGGADDSRLVLGVVGYVPVAEYLFFSLETILCSLVWLSIFNQRDPLQWPPKSQLRSHWRITGLAALVLMGGGGALMTYEPRLEYLGLILMWVAPVLMVQWAFGAEALRAHAKCLVLSIASAAVYLSVADQWAMHHGIWSISQQHSLPLLIQDLPVEEIIFFLLTATMCNFGLTLAMVVTHTGFRFKDVIDWGHTAAAAAARDRASADASEEAAKSSVSVPLNLAILSTLALMAAFNADVPRSLQILFTVFTTVCYGFPHAALDPLLIYQNFSNAKIRQWRWVQYFGLLTLACALWMFLPQLALLLFMVMTVQHFGEGDAQSNPKSLGWIEIVARGGSFLVAIYSNHAEVVDIFTLIVGGSSEAAVGHVMAACVMMQVGYAVCTTYFLVHLLTSLHLGSSQRLLLEVAALNAMYYTAPPLLAFMVYFNVYHCQRHMVRVMGMNTWQASSRVTMIVGVVVTLLATFALGLWYSGIQAAAPFVQASADSFWLDARPMLRPVFIIISSITVPHMVLVHQVFSKSPNGDFENTVVEEKQELMDKKDHEHKKSTSDYFVGLV